MYRAPQSRRLLPPLKPWRYPTCRLTNWARRLTRSGPRARRPPKESKSRPAAWSASGNGHGFPARSENSCWTTRGCATGCAGPSSIAEGPAWNIGVAEAGTTMRPSNGRDRTSRILRDRQGSTVSVSLPVSTAPPVLRDCWPDIARSIDSAGPRSARALHGYRRGFLGEPLFGPQNGPTKALLPSNPEELAMLKAELLRAKKDHAFGGCTASSKACKLPPR